LVHTDAYPRLQVVTHIRRELIAPTPRSCIRLHGDDRIAEQIVKLAAHRAIDLRAGVADGPVHEIQFRIVRTGEPHRAAALLPAVAEPRLVPELAPTRPRIPSPQTASRCRLVPVANNTTH